MKSKEEIEQLAENSSYNNSEHFEDYQDGMFYGYIKGYTQCQHNMADEIVKLEEKLKLSYENSFISENIHELVELFTELASIKTLSYYKYEYEYNDFFHKFDISIANVEADNKNIKSY